jgi:hypothetical protein
MLVWLGSAAAFPSVSHDSGDPGEWEMSWVYRGLPTDIGLAYKHRLIVSFEGIGNAWRSPWGNPASQGFHLISLWVMDVWAAPETCVDDSPRQENNGRVGVTQGDPWSSPMIRIKEMHWIGAHRRATYGPWTAT